MSDDKDIDDRNGQTPDDRKSSEGWLKAIAYAEKQFEHYQTRCDNIDRLFASLKELAAEGRDRQFQLFWANIQTIGPSIYSRPPVPVVVPRFRDRRPVQRTAAELLERCSSATFDLGGINDTMLQVRDDLTTLARGVVWIRYEKKEGEKTERVCIEHVDRKDFAHDPARYWREVDWVAKKSHLTKKQMKKRFPKSKWEDAVYMVQKDDKENNAANEQEKAAVWEIWCRSDNEVIWVTQGVADVLESDKPHLTLDGFFPCPRPAYSTVQRRSLLPVPDVGFYRDQLEEINELTGRIAALSESLKVKGFYNAGAADIGDAIEAAVASFDDRKVLVPVSNWAALGGSGAKDSIAWLPIDMIAEVIRTCVELRKELIQDVYQITGLSDIMRGSTEASETATAQQLKANYGSVRIRDRQQELIRIAREVTLIAGEIMSENFATKTLADMSQLDLPSDADIAKQIADLQEQAVQIKTGVERQAREAQGNPQMMQAAQQNPEQAQQIIQQLQQQANQQLEALEAKASKVSETVTIDQVVKLLRDDRMRPFVLDIETDSTIAPDENAQKERANEFLTAMGGFLQPALQAVQLQPKIAPLMAETLKFVAGQYRAGRQLDTAIDEFSEQMKEAAGQPAPPNMEHVKARAEAQAMQQRSQSEAATAQADAQEKQANAQKTVIEAQNRAAEDDLKRRIAEQREVDASEDRRVEREGKVAVFNAESANRQQKHAQDMDIGGLQIEKLRLEIEGVREKTIMAQTTADAKIDQMNTATDNSVRSTEASVTAAERKASFKESEPA